jgi:hypothetical protein
LLRWMWPSVGRAGLLIFTDFSNHKPLATSH